MDSDGLTVHALVPARPGHGVARAAGALAGLVVGDALGVPYEFSVPPVGEPQMAGGGLGGYDPGEGSDDSQMTTLVALTAAEGYDLATDHGQDVLALRFMGWAAHGPADIGAQTAGVLLRASRTLGLPGRLADEKTMEGAAEACRTESYAWQTETGRSAGNGALMRTAAVAVASQWDRQLTASVARRVAVLTHADWRAVATCVLMTEVVRHAIADGEWHPDAGVDLLPVGQRDAAAGWIREAIDGRPEDFADGGFTVNTWRGAVSAVDGAMAIAEPGDRFAAAVTSAVQGGGDTDTVAAVAGAMAGAVVGIDAVREDWCRRAHVRLRTGYGGIDHTVTVEGGTVVATPRAMGRE